MITTIAILLLLGIVLIIVEVLLIPGVTIAAIGAAIAFIVSIILAYIHFGFTWSIAVLLFSIIASAITLVICTRRKALKKLSLDNTIDSKTSENSFDTIDIGSVFETTSRLAPMGNIFVNGKNVEAKSVSGYIDPHKKVVVVGHEDSVIIVKILNE